MTGRRIGGAPIPLAAVLALAGLIALGIWLAPLPRPAGAQTAPDLTWTVSDVGDGVIIPEADVRAALGLSESETVTFLLMVPTGNPEFSSSIVFLPNTGNISIVGTQAMADVGTFTLDLQATRSDSTVVTGTLDVTVIQNPLELDGVMVQNPDNWIPESGACAIYDDGTGSLTAGGTEGSRIALDATTGKNLVSGGGCYTTGDSVDVVINNMGTAASRHVLYTTGGDQFIVVPEILDAAGLEEHDLNIAGGG